MGFLIIHNYILVDFKIYNSKFLDTVLFYLLDIRNNIFKHCKKPKNSQ